MILEKLKSLETESIGRGIPIIGSGKGRFLYEKVLEAKPKKVLELGTANGYSGIILGYLGAKLTTIDVDARIQEEAKENYKKFGVKAKIINGDAVEEIKKLGGKFDIIFIDFIKSKYIYALEDAIRLCRKNGYIIADNITFPGCQDYRREVINDARLETEIIDIEDGLASSRKL
ncbi:TPA: methyltransferase domain-containing protein [Candidatus Woesearchaeota archaeon]|nr:O-methyltransferase family 3 [archaeon GW2011_AR15]MBS3103400.1 class I SAM-dependent methyltransferase [Candidatus Woesearchaeota archaeon]HIH41517.1 methyltransferase domain-containing protein [Candidatus Woesearchaeota archaeon]